MFATEMRIAFEHAEFSALWVVEPPNYFCAGACDVAGDVRAMGDFHVHHDGSASRRR